MDRIVDLDLGIQPEAAVSGAVVIQTESSTVLTFNTMRPTDEMSPYGGPYMTDAGTAIFRFERCLATRFGYPNDEARGGIRDSKIPSMESTRCKTPLGFEIQFATIDTDSLIQVTTTLEDISFSRFMTAHSNV